MCESFFHRSHERIHSWDVSFSFFHYISFVGRSPQKPHFVALLNVESSARGD